MEERGTDVIEMIRATQDAEKQGVMINHLTRQSFLRPEHLSGVFHVVSQIGASKEKYNTLINLVRRYQKQLIEHSSELLCCIEQIQPMQEKAGLISCLTHSCPEVIKILSGELFQMAEKMEDLSSARSILKALIDVNFDFVNQNGDRFIQILLRHKSGSQFLVERGIEKDRSFARKHGSKILDLVRVS